MLAFQQSEQNAERRRWIIVLVDSSDGVTGLTGQTGTVKISKNGGAAFDSTNSIVEVDPVNMPGHYYVTLTQSELDTLGFISITAKTPNSLAFHDRAIVSYNDPYVSMGGFSGGGNQGPVLTKKQLDYIVEQVWKYKFTDELTAKDVLNIAAQHPVTDLSGIEARLGEIVIPETDLSPVLEKISSISFPQPIDYKDQFADIAKQLAELTKTSKINVEPLARVVEKLQDKMALADESIVSTLSGVEELKSSLTELGLLLNEIKEKSSEVSDMDKRFENMTSIMQKQQLNELTKKIEQLGEKILVALVESKFDLLEEIKN
jgi:methyl-accepting chemotaxis protein